MFSERYKTPEPHTTEEETRSTIERVISNYLNGTVETSGWEIINTNVLAYKPRIDGHNVHGSDIHEQIIMH